MSETENRGQKCSPISPLYVNIQNTDEEKRQQNRRIREDVGKRKRKEGERREGKGTENKR